MYQHNFDRSTDKHNVSIATAASIEHALVADAPPIPDGYTQLMHNFLVSKWVPSGELVCVSFSLK